MKLSELNEATSELDNPELQSLIRQAMQILDYAAQQTDDNRLEANYTRDGVKMCIILEEKNK